MSMKSFYHRLISPLVHKNVTRRMTSKFKMLIKKTVNKVRLFHSMIVFAKLFLHSTTSLPNILHVTIVGSSS